MYGYSLQYIDKSRDREEIYKGDIYLDLEKFVEDANETIKNYLETSKVKIEHLEKMKCEETRKIVNYGDFYVCIVKHQIIESIPSK